MYQLTEEIAGCLAPGAAKAGRFMNTRRLPSPYQINTRVWLTRLLEALGRAATLDDIPGSSLGGRTSRLLRGWRTESDLAQAPQNCTKVSLRHRDRVLAYGRDPYFAGWPDTLQLDYSKPATQEAMCGDFLRIAGQCDGVLRGWRGFSPLVDASRTR